MELFGISITILSFMIGIFAAILAWQTVKNGKIMKDSFAKMDERTIKMDERFAIMDEKAEQRHQEVTKLLEKGFGNTAQLLEKGFGDMGGWMKRTEEILEKGFGTIIRDVNEIKTK